jgi:hypothetical protein
MKGVTMRKLAPLVLSGLFIIALIASPGSDKICYAQDAVEPIAATVDIRPNTINLKRNGNFIMGMIKLPEGYSIENIYLTSIAVTKINGVLLDPAIAADWAFIDEEIMDSVIAKFPGKTLKEAIENALPADVTYPTNVEISVGGTLTDDIKTPFEGTDQVRVIKPGKGWWKNKDMFGRWTMALDSPQNLTCQIIEDTVYFDWDDVIGATKYCVDVEVPVDLDGDQTTDFVAKFSFGTSDRTDGGLMGDSYLYVPISEFMYDMDGDGSPETQLSGEATSKVKALAPGKGNGSQKTPFSDECIFVLP